METLQSMTDDQLVVEYYSGDSSAFDILLERHQQSVYNYIFYKVRKAELAEDLFQETFVKAIVCIQKGTYVASGRFKGWLTRIAHNLVIDHFRQLKSENTISNDESPVDILNNKSLCEGTVEDELIELQTIDDIRKLISHLSDAQREVLEMRYYQDLSFKDIADITGVSINTALGRMRYALINLRRLAEENNIVLTAL